MKKRAIKTLISASIALLLVVMVGLSIITTNKRVKAETYNVDTSKYYAITNYLGISYNGLLNYNIANTSYEAYYGIYGTPITDVGGRPIVFTPRNKSNFLNYDYFAISIRRNYVSGVYYYSLGVYEYFPSDLEFGEFVGVALYSKSPSTNYNFGVYLDYETTIDNDITNADYLLMLNDGFYAVEGVPLPNNDYSRTELNDSDLNSVLCSAIMGTKADGSFVYQSFVHVVDTNQTAYQNGWDTGYDYGLDLGQSIGYQTGYDSGYDDGFNIGEAQGIDIGINQGSGAFSEYTNILTTAWNGAASLLNTQVLGQLKIIHLILLPVLLGIFLIVLKLIRG